LARPPKKTTGAILSIHEVFVPIFWPEKKPEVMKTMSEKLTQNEIAICQATRTSEVDFKKAKAKIDAYGFCPTQLAPGEGVDDPDQDGDDDGTDDMIDRAQNHLSAMADEDSVEASTERLAKAHALITEALAKRRGGTHGRFAVKH